MKVIIIEDEKLAAEKLESMLYELDKNIKVLARLGSVKETVQWLSTNQNPDLAFVDIQLSDDQSFEIFKRLNIDFPVVFTTAYDKYLLTSFEFNSIDYLLKPITQKQLTRVLNKIKTLEKHFISQNLERFIRGGTNQTTERIMVRKGSGFKAINLNGVAFFCSEHKVVFLMDKNNQRFICDKNLSELESMLNKKDFLRLNRQYICNRSAVDNFRGDQGKIIVTLNNSTKTEVTISKENAPQFRGWIKN